MSPLPPIRSSVLTRLALLGCLIFTALVVHTCVRIEYLNARNGYYLPRSSAGAGNAKWRVAAEGPFRQAWERSVTLDRAATYGAAHPDRPLPAIDKLAGPPYSATEQASLRAALEQNRLQRQLHAWVSTWGLAQYLFAPAALAAAFIAYRRSRSLSIPTASMLCAVAAAAAFAMALYRGYYTSLGW